MLEPGGRIAVNVANLGRRPYRSLAGDVTDILQEISACCCEARWCGGRAAPPAGRARGARSSARRNPVLRDVTERIVIASKGRFDRAMVPEQRLSTGLPSTATISRDEFLEATTDLWEIPPESATAGRAPGSVPRGAPPAAHRALHLRRTTSCSTRSWVRGRPRSPPSAPAATTSASTPTPTLHRRCRERIADDEREDDSSRPDTAMPFAVRLPAVVDDEDATGPLAREARDGLLAKEFARGAVGAVRVRGHPGRCQAAALGIDVSFIARDGDGEEWAFELAGTFTSSGAGLRRADVLWRAVGKASIWQQARGAGAFVVLTTDVPHRALRAASPSTS